MIKTVEVKRGRLIEDYESYASLFWTIKEFKTEANLQTPKIKGRRIWMINSTENGGGVAEMLPRMISVIRQLDLQAEWVVMETDKMEFFTLTKKLHNLIHGAGKPGFTAEDKEVYEAVNKENAEDFISRLDPNDIVVIHDPQPMGMAKYIKEKMDIKIIWRCHIGLDEENEQTNSAWGFLEEYFKYYDHHVFSAPEYIPKNLSGHVSIIYPSIDPLTPKSRELTFHRVTGTLANGDLMPAFHPTATLPFLAQAKRLQPDGSFASPKKPEDIGLIFRPIITQVSRWDRLKGFFPLIEAFSLMKRNADKISRNQTKVKRPIIMSRLVLAGPDPEFVKDDPEGLEVLNELINFYQELPQEIQVDVALLVLPMISRKENALIVNAIQRCSTIVVQNSLREGFGLTATEAMWKAKPLLVSSACGLRQQVRDKIDGRMVDNAEDPQEIAQVLAEMLEEPNNRDVWASNAQRRVIDNFLIFNQIKSWLNVLVSTMHHKSKSFVKN